MSDEELAQLSSMRHAAAARLARSRRIAIACIITGVLAVVAYGILELCGFAIWPRNPDVWQRITYKHFPKTDNSTDLFYNSRVTKGEASRVGEFLKSVGYFHDDHAVSVFLTRTPEAYVLSCFVTHIAYDDPATLAEFTEMRRRLSAEVLAGEPVVIDMCSPVIEAGVPPKLTVLKTLR